MVGPGGRVIETDQAPAMVEAALRSAADLGLDNVEARVMDAERLELPDASVDAVVCRWGLMLMADPAAVPGGGAAGAAAGRPPGRGRLGSAGGQPVARRGAGRADRGGIDPAGGAGQRPRTSSPWRDEARLRDLVAGAGFAGVVVDRIPANWKYADADEYWRVQTALSTAAARTLAPLDDDRLARIRRRVDERLATFRTADGLVLPGVSLGVAAHRPL